MENKFQIIDLFTDLQQLGNKNRKKQRKKGSAFSY